MKMLIKTLLIVVALLLSGCYVHPRTASYGVNVRSGAYDQGYYRNGYYNDGYYNNGYRNNTSYHNTYHNRDQIIRDHRRPNNGGSWQYHQDGHNARGQYRGRR